MLIGRVFPRPRSDVVRIDIDTQYQHPILLRVGTGKRSRFAALTAEEALQIAGYLLTASGSVKQQDAG